MHNNHHGLNTKGFIMTISGSYTPTFNKTADPIALKKDLFDLNQQFQSKQQELTKALYHSSDSTNNNNNNLQRQDILESNRIDVLI